MADLRDVSKMSDTERAVESAIDDQKRAANCLVDIKNVLQRWGCAIDPFIQISGRGISQSGFIVVPLVKTSIQ